MNFRKGGKETVGTLQNPTAPGKLILRTERYLLRLFNYRDLGTVVDIGRACFTRVFDVDIPLLEATAHELPDAFIVAEVQGQVVGFIACRLELGRLVEVPKMGLPVYYDNVVEGEVVALAVLPEARGMGIGRRLLEHALAALTTRHVQVCRLETFHDNNIAINMYRRAGFKTVQNIPRYYPDGRAAGIMAKPLNQHLEVTGAFPSETDTFGDVVVREKTGKGGLRWK